VERSRRVPALDAMTATREFAVVENGRSLPWGDVPQWRPDEFTGVLDRQLSAGARLCALFGVPDGAGTQLVAVVAFDAGHTIAVARSAPMRERFQSLSPRHPQVHLFEREVWEQHALLPHGHPWIKPVRREVGDGPGVIDFFRVEGDEVHEVAVGPVHAGIIEPGHFRFQCHGEEVLHLEIALGYQHRGIEEALVGGPHPGTMSQMETVAGDTTIAHATAYAMVLEALAGAEAPPRAQWLRAVTLELERLANHAGDLGALANDVAFLPTSAACGRIRGDFLNLTATVCGNRFGRGVVRPGGCRCDLESDRAARVLEQLGVAVAEADEAASWLWESNSTRTRFEGVGVVSNEQAEALGLVGPTARASGLLRDVRVDHPAAWHRVAPMPASVWRGGDVLARARVRWLEMQRSGRYLQEQLPFAPQSELRVPVSTLSADTVAVALVEGWRGEVCHVAITDGVGRLRCYKIVDPSFHNWTALALAMRGQAISDFPLCNKSFNLSYCGFDL
jgi:Ni,Fe-hydrogenase III large subunit